jgi:hypothetical protein
MAEEPIRNCEVHFRSRIWAHHRSAADPSEDCAPGSSSDRPDRRKKASGLIEASQPDALEAPLSRSPSSLHASLHPGMRIVIR